MSNCCNNDCCEHGTSMIQGVFTDGVYTAGNVTLAVQQVTVSGRSGYKIKFTTDDGVQELTVLDGVSADLTQVNAMLATLQAAQADWADAEDDRADAEADRAEAEGDPDGTDTDTSTRWGMHRALLSLKAQLQTLLDQQEDLIEAAEEAVEDAQAAATQAVGALGQITGDILGAIQGQLFISNGDVIKFNRVMANNDLTESYVTTDSESHGLNAGGYVTEDRTLIHIKIPIAKSLYYVTGVTIDKFKALIHNAGGYALSGGFNINGDDYLSLIQSTGIDKVQNCIHVMIRKNSRFYLTNNASVRCRGVDIQMTFEANMTASSTSTSGTSSDTSGTNSDTSGTTTETGGDS